MSIDKHEAVKDWFNRGEKLVDQRIKSMLVLNVMPYTPDRMEQIQALLQKFLPIWHEETHYPYLSIYDYVYADGSYTRVLQDVAQDVVVYCGPRNHFLNDDKIAEIYDKLAELGLTTMSVVNDH